jgi:hypothetical protein
MDVSIDVADTPRPDQVKIEFLVLAPKEMPRPRIAGKVVLPGDRADTTVEFGTTVQDRFLKLLVEGRLNAQSLDVTITPFFQLVGQTKPLAVTDGNLKKAAESLTAAAAPLEARLRALPQPNKSKGKNDKSDSDPRDALQKQLAAVRRAQSQLKLLKSLEGKFAQQVRLQVRAFYQADEAIVKLVEPRK